MGRRYREVNVRGLEDVCCNHIVEAAAGARNLSVGEYMWLLLEASNRRGIIYALLLGQRAPRKNGHE